MMLAVGTDTYCCRLLTGHSGVGPVEPPSPAADVSDFLGPKVRHSIASP